MKIIKKTYEYLFYSIYKEFVKIYPKDLDPAFYTIVAMFLIFIFTVGIALVSLWIKFVTIDIPKFIFFVFTVFYFGLHILYFNKNKIRRINIEFENEKNKNKYIWILLSVLFISFSIIIIGMKNKL